MDDNINHSLDKLDEVAKLVAELFREKILASKATGVGYHKLTVDESSGEVKAILPLSEGDYVSITPESLAHHWRRFTFDEIEADIDFLKGLVAEWAERAKQQEEKDEQLNELIAKLKEMGI